MKMTLVENAWVFKQYNILAFFILFYLLLYYSSF